MAEDVLNKVISFLAGDPKDETDAQMLLRQILKDLPQNKYASFYRPRTGDVDPALAQWFYAMYRTIYPARVFAQDPLQINRIKHITIESFLSEDILETERRLRTVSIESRAKTLAPVDLARELKTDLNTLSESFTSSWINSADRCYSAILAFLQFVNFNFPSLLQKFDPKFVEGDFTSPPQFAPVKADFIAKDLNDFLVVSEAITPELDWKNILGVLRSCRGGVDLVAPVLWSGLVVDLRDIKKSNILMVILQLTLKNPIWRWKSRNVSEKLTESWLAAKEAEVQGLIDRILTDRQNVQIEALAQAVFSSADVIRLSWYTPKQSAVLTRKNLSDYTYALGANYLEDFLEDFFDREIEDLCDILLVRGQWTSGLLSREMSAAFHDLSGISARLKELDETLGVDGKDGARLEAALSRIDRDKTQIRYINGLVDELNEKFLDQINIAAQSLIIIGKHLKAMVEDIQKNPHDLIINWKELTAVSHSPISQRISEDYKKINYFVQLLRLCTRPPEI